MDKACVPLVLIIDLLGDGYVASSRMQNGGDGYERVRRRALPFFNIRMQMPEVVSVFVGDDVAVDTWANYLFGNFRDRPGCCVRQEIYN